MINSISIKFIFSLITRCKKFIFSLNWSSYPLCYPWFWKTFQLASENLFNWRMFVYYFSIYTIKRWKYIINVIITICYYRLPINLINILRKRIPIKIWDFSLSWFSSMSCWSECTKLPEMVTHIRNDVATHWLVYFAAVITKTLSIREAELPRTREGLSIEGMR